MFKNIKRVTVHPLFFACLAWIIFTDSSLYLLIITLTIFLHECGHIFIYWRRHIIIEQVRLQPFGVSITPQQPQRIPHRVQLQCALAGPSVNMICAGLCYVITLITDLPDWLTVFYAANLFLGLFNLLPIIPLDGGRLLVISLSRIWNEYIAQLIGAISSFLFGLGMLIWGGYVLMDSGMNVSLCFLSIYILVCLAVKIYQHKKKRTSNVKSRT